jgi:hypothetical protein
MELPMADNVIPIDAKKRTDLSEAQQAVALLAKALPIMPSIQDPAAFKAIMAERLARYPAAVLMAAINQAINDFKQMPSIHEMIVLCDRLVPPRPERLEAIEWEQLQNERQRDAQAQRVRKERRIMWLQDVERRARERFGDALAGDIALADSIVVEVRRGGCEIYWQDALAAGEEWAAKFCRLMALAARIRDAVHGGRARWDVGLALAKNLTTNDEAEVRELIDEIDCLPGGFGERLTGSFWVQLWRVHRACGCDVPANVGLRRTKRRR